MKMGEDGHGEIKLIKMVNLVKKWLIWHVGEDLFST